MLIVVNSLQACAVDNRESEAVFKVYKMMISELTDHYRRWGARYSKSDPTLYSGQILLGQAGHDWLIITISRDIDMTALSSLIPSN